MIYSGRMGNLYYGGLNRKKSSGLSIVYMLCVFGVSIA